MADFDAALATDATPLRPASAVGAILLLRDGRYLMQLRDCKPGIFFPGHWGLFGGAHDLGEDDLTALLRELREELDLDLTGEEIHYFTRFDFDLGFSNLAPIHRTFFTVRLPTDALERARLGEGTALRAFTPAEVLVDLRVTPYDAFALWLHINQNRLMT